MSTLMPTHEHADTALGLLGTIESYAGEILDELRRADEWGAIDSIRRLSWAAGGNDNFSERGNFRSIVVINESASDVAVGFAPNAGVIGRDGTIVLPAKCYMVLPLRSVTVSVGGANPGTAVVIPLAVTQPFSAGKLA